MTANIAKKENKIGTNDSRLMRFTLQCCRVRCYSMRFRSNVQCAKAKSDTDERDFFSNGLCS